MKVFVVDDHDFSVYEDKTELEIREILKSHEHKSVIADILVDIGILKSNPFIGLDFSNIVLPMMGRSYPQLSINDIVGVQPMMQNPSNNWGKK